MSEDVILIDRLNVVFKMYDIPMTAEFKEHERGVQRPYRLICRAKGNVRGQLGIWLSENQTFAAFGTREQISKYSERVIKKRQAAIERETEIA